MYGGVGKGCKRCRKRPAVALSAVGLSREGIVTRNNEGQEMVLERNAQIEHPVGRRKAVNAIEWWWWRGGGSMSVFWEKHSSAYHSNTNNTILRSARFTSQSSIPIKVIVIHGNVLQTYENFLF